MDEKNQSTLNMDSSISPNDKLANSMTGDINVRKPEIEVVDISCSDDEEVERNFETNRISCDSNDSMETDTCVDGSASEYETTTSEYQPFELKWDHHPHIYPLYYNNTAFASYIEPYLNLAKKFGEECTRICWRSYQRTPTLNEFLNYVMSECVPRDAWTGMWEVVNSDRSGWPLQYIQKAVIQIWKVAFVTPLSDPQIDTNCIELYDKKLENVTCLDDINLWEVVPIKSNEGGSTENAKSVLAIIRTFRDLIDITSESDGISLDSYFSHTFYERMELLFHVECGVGGVSSYDRGRIITAVKYHHVLRNQMQDMSLLQYNVEISENSELREIGIDGSRCDRLPSKKTEDEQRSSKCIAMGMQISRHKLELNFLLKPDLRPLINTLPTYGTNECANYEYILVMKDASLTELEDVLNIIKELQGTSMLEDLNLKSKIKICTDLEIALKSCSKGAHIFVTSGNHYIGGLHNLSDGGSIIGVKISNVDVAIFPADDVGDVWLLCDGPQDSRLVIKNVDFVLCENANNQYTGIQITSGDLLFDKCTMRDLRVTNDVERQAQKVKGAVVLMTECDFEFRDNN